MSANTQAKPSLPARAGRALTNRGGAETRRPRVAPGPMGRADGSRGAATHACSPHRDACDRHASRFVPRVARATRGVSWSSVPRCLGVSYSRQEQLRASASPRFVIAFDACLSARSPLLASFALRRQVNFARLANQLRWELELGVGAICSHALRTRVVSDERETD
jgi:hypothetical protein